jgi:glutamate-5-semialdehyde dehydrogenase
MLNEGRISAIADEIKSVVSLDDPLNEIFEERILPNGLRVHKMRVPVGVIGVIYEARPNVTMDIASLAIKTGNAAILRGGSETINSNRVLVSIIRKALEKNDIPAEVIQFIDDPDRKLVSDFLRMHEYVDILIPRGGAALHKFCRENSSIPVITGGIGICHLFVDELVDFDSAIQVIRNAKTQRPSVCNALDTVLVHKAISKQFLPKLITALTDDQVAVHMSENAFPYLNSNAEKIDRGTGAAGSINKSGPSVVIAGPNDFDVEWLSMDIGIKVVDDVGDAIEHIRHHSTGHSDGILSENEDIVMKFVAEVDSAVVYVNASTRFTDGAQLGLGAEVAVSTQRLHARGPMGLKELTTYKWIVRGEYHVRQ